MNNDEDTSGKLELALLQNGRLVSATISMKELSDALDKGALLAGVVEHLQGCLKWNIAINDQGRTAGQTGGVIMPNYQH